MEGMHAQQVMNGSKGEIWIDGTYMAQCTACTATVEAKKAAIQIARKMGESNKIVGYTGKGSLKLNHVSSYFITKLGNDLKNGITTTCTIISNLDDPDAIGAERVAVKDAVFDNLNLIGWENAKAGEDTYNFTFSDWEVLDSADE